MKTKKQNNGKEEKVRANLARLFLIANLLYQNKNGLTYEEIGEECEVSSKTARRDVALLEKSGWPVWNKEGRVRILADRIRPPVCLSIPEAATIFMASRLLLNYGNAQNPRIMSTLKILSSVVPDRLRYQIFNTIDWMQKQKKDERFVQNLERLEQAWIEGRRVRIAYQKLGSTRPKDREIDPYFIQPSVRDHGNYVIAFCHVAGQVRTFKIERISSVMLLNDRYKIPERFDANEFLDPAWGVVSSEKVVTVKLKFAADIAQIARETQWHISQAIREQTDGSIMVTFRLALSSDFEGFILSWADKVEVLEPAYLKQKISAKAKAIAGLYK
jgi:predicted DNA-binding transcriptional regulator YafY